MRRIEVYAYNPNWVFLFEEEAEKLKLLLGTEAESLYHIGSTSVPGLAAKPTIDIMPVVKDIRSIDTYNEKMMDLGYEPKGENGIPGRRYFQKGGNHRSHHVHVYQVGSSEIKRHIAFRDYLRNHPADKKSYGELKQRLAAEFPYDIEAYINGKDSLVKQIEGKALKWVNTRN